TLFRPDLEEVLRRDDEDERAEPVGQRISEERAEVGYPDPIDDRPQTAACSPGFYCSFRFRSPLRRSPRPSGRLQPRSPRSYRWLNRFAAQPSSWLITPAVRLAGC